MRRVQEAQRVLEPFPLLPDGLGGQAQRLGRVFDGKARDNVRLVGRFVVPDYADPKH